MKITCKCGHLITDATDRLSHKAHLIADEDKFDFLHDSSIFSRITRRMYQCDACGRLWIYDRRNSLKSFMPEGDVENFLASKIDRSGLG
jgi:hypothetical protein